MEVIIQPDAESASLIAARLIARQVREKPSSVLGLATGSTPLPLYRELVRLHGEERLSFARVTAFNLDEYVGLGPDHPCAYARFMREHLFEGIDIPSANRRIPDGMAPNITAHCEAYEAAIRDAGGIDLQVLGIGSDGHLGFNEPSSSLVSRTRIKTLTEVTRTANRRFFPADEEVPWHVITMGLGTIMDARMCLLLAFGEAKAEAVRLAVEGPVSAMVPASVLQFHPRAKLLLDEAAASRLARGDYYRWVYRNKPAWQTDL